MMGSGERGVSICFTTLRAYRRQVRDSQRNRLAIVPTGTIRFILSGAFVVSLPSYEFLTPRRGRRQASCRRNSSPSHPIRWRMTASLRATATRTRAMPRAFATFMPQARRLDHLRLRTSSVVRGLVERGAGEFVAATADPALNIGFAGLVAKPGSGRDARPRPVIAGSGPAGRSSPGRPTP